MLKTFAIFSLCIFLQFSESHAKDILISELTTTAEQGEAESQNQLGLLYYNGGTLKKNHATAIKWFKKAASQSHTDAIINMATVYQDGTGVEKNLLTASTWYKKGVEKGDVRAMYNLGKIHQSGELSFMKEYKKAAKLFKQAAQKGHLASQNKIAHLYSNGLGVKKDNSKAMYWYLKAANQGSDEAQFNAGINYANGTGVTKNLYKAILWLKKAAKQEFTKSYAALGNVIIIQGHPIKAVPWLRKAFESGDEQAGARLTAMYEQKIVGVPEDPDDALQWYINAANKGDRDAQYRLGQMYLSMGDEKNGIKWIEAAAEQNQLYAVNKVSWNGDYPRKKKFYSIKHRKKFNNFKEQMNNMKNSYYDLANQGAK